MANILVSLLSMKQGTSEFLFHETMHGILNSKYLAISLFSSYTNPSDFQLVVNEGFEWVAGVKSTTAPV